MVGSTMKSRTVYIPLRATAFAAALLAASLDGTSDALYARRALDKETQRLVTRAHIAKARAVVSQVVASALQKLAARRLIDEGLTPRDVPRILSPSHPRFMQLVAAAELEVEMHGAIEKALGLADADAITFSVHGEHERKPHTG